MSFIGTSIIDSSISKTKKFLFPIKKVLWLKLGLISILAGIGQSSTNFNLPVGNNFPSEFLQIILDNLHWITMAAIGVLIIGFVFALIRALFNFVLLESVEKRQCFILKSLSQNSKLAFSYFLLSVVINGAFMIILFALALPLLIRIFSDVSNAATIINFTYLWVSIPLFILLGIILTIINSIIFNLVMPDMYLKRITSLNSLRRMSKLFFKQIKEIIIYWIMKFLFRLAAGIISIIVFLILVLLFLIMAGILFGIGFLIYLISSTLLIPLIIAAVILGVLLFLLLMYVIAVVLVPIPVFFTNYRIEFYKGLIKKNKTIS